MRLAEGPADDRLGRRRVLGDHPQLEPLAATTEGAEDHALALDGKSCDRAGAHDQVACCATDREQRMLVALGRLKDACLGPTSRVRHHRENEAPWADPLRIWNGYIWTGRVLAIGVRIAADQPERT